MSFTERSYRPRGEWDLFPTGCVKVLPGAARLCLEHGLNIETFLGRHLIGDWGNLDPDVSSSNDAAVRNCETIRSMYFVPEGEYLWIITSGDRLETVVFLHREWGLSKLPRYA